MISRTGQNWNHTSKATQRVGFLLDHDNKMALIEEFKGKNNGGLTGANSRRTKTLMQIRPEEVKGSVETAQFLAQ